MSNSVNPWTAAHQASLSFTISQSLLKFMSIESVVLSNHLLLCRPVPSYLQSFPASGSFPMTWLFTSGGQRTGTSASASVLPMNIEVWVPLGLTGLILLSKGLSRVFPSTTIQKHQFFRHSAFFMVQFCHQYLSRKWQPTPVFLPWEIPWTEEPSGLQSTRSGRVRHDWRTEYEHIQWARKRESL